MYIDVEQIGYQHWRTEDCLFGFKLESYGTFEMVIDRAITLINTHYLQKDIQLYKSSLVAYQYVPNKYRIDLEKAYINNQEHNFRLHAVIRCLKYKLKHGDALRKVYTYDDKLLNIPNEVIFKYNKLFNGVCTMLYYPNMVKHDLETCISGITIIGDDIFAIDNETYLPFIYY